MESAGFYFELEPPDLYMGGGMYMIPDSLLGRYRQGRRRQGPRSADREDRGRAAGPAGLRRRGPALQARPGRLRRRPPQRRAAQAQGALRGHRGEDPRGVLLGGASSIIVSSASSRSSRSTAG
ncbi:MAG: DUF2461 domain-containing protein [Sphingobacterium sp.]|nr:DUF2461 domain-containing protein [Sphingobacterium sp.]